MENFTCNSTIYPKLQILDDNETKKLFSLTFSGGSFRAYCSTLGIMRAIVKNEEIDIEEIPYISSISGSSWITMILSHTHDSLEEILLFDIDRSLTDFKENKLVDIAHKFQPNKDIILPFILNTTSSYNEIINKYVLNEFELGNKSLCKRKCEGKLHSREMWPTYIISASYENNGILYPVEYTPSYYTIGGETTSLFINDCKEGYMSIISDSVISESCSKISSDITSTVMLASSSFLLNTLLKYNIKVDEKDFSLLDGGYNDFFSIVPLLRRKIKRIFCSVSSILNSDGTIMIKNWFKDTDDYESIFYVDEYKNMLKEINKKHFNRELCYFRGNFRVKENSQYLTSEYETEIIFYFVTQVSEFIDQLPPIVFKSPEMIGFPNFSLLFSDQSNFISYSKLQSYSLILLTEWSFNEIYKRESDFFN